MVVHASHKDVKENRYSQCHVRGAQLQISKWTGRWSANGTNSFASHPWLARNDDCYKLREFCMLRRNDRSEKLLLKYSSILIFKEPNLMKLRNDFFIFNIVTNNPKCIYVSLTMLNQSFHRVVFCDTRVPIGQTMTHVTSSHEWLTFSNRNDI